MIAGITFLLCAYACVAIIAVLATLKVQCKTDGGWGLIALAGAQLAINTIAALYAFEVVSWL